MPIVNPSTCNRKIRRRGCAWRFSTAGNRSVNPHRRPSSRPSNFIAA